MGNSILNQINGQQSAQPAAQQSPTAGLDFSNPMAVMQQFNQFKKSFSGNPQQAVMQMISSGQRSNADLQQAMQMAKQFSHLFK